MTDIVERVKSATKLQTNKKTILKINDFFRL